jgi:hypothetical protein
VTIRTSLSHQEDYHFTAFTSKNYFMHKITYSSKLGKHTLMAGRKICLEKNVMELDGRVTGIH